MRHTLDSRGGAAGDIGRARSAGRAHHLNPRRGGPPNYVSAAAAGRDRQASGVTPPRSSPMASLCALRPPFPVVATNEFGRPQ